MLRYRFEFVGTGSLPRPDNVYRDAPILVRDSPSSARCVPNRRPRPRPSRHSQRKSSVASMIPSDPNEVEIHADPGTRRPASHQT